MDVFDDPKGYYRRLGVARTATPEELRAAFRERVKRYHPDHAGPAADSLRLRLVVEAWDVLGDPARRQAYDEEIRAGARRRARPSGAPARPRRRRNLDLRAILLQPRRLVAAVVVLGIVAASMSGLWLSTRRQLADRDMQLNDLGLRLSDMISGNAQARALERSRRLAGLEGMVTSDPAGIAQILAIDMPFPVGGSQLDAGGLRRLDLATAALAEAARRLPSDRDWFMLVEARAGPAVDRNGVPVEAWSRTMVRIATVLDYLAAQGVPAERLLTRFVAGSQTAGRDAYESAQVAIQLLCCRDAPRPEG